MREMPESLQDGYKSLGESKQSGMHPLWRLHKKLP